MASFRLNEEDYSLCGSEGGCKHCGGTGRIVNKQNGSVENCPYCLLDDEEGEEDRR